MICNKEYLHAGDVVSALEETDGRTSTSESRPSVLESDPSTDEVSSRRYPSRSHRLLTKLYYVIEENCNCISQDIRNCVCSL